MQIQCLFFFFLLVLIFFWYNYIVIIWHNNGRASNPHYFSVPAWIISMPSLSPGGLCLFSLPRWGCDEAARLLEPRAPAPIQELESRRQSSVLQNGSDEEE